MRRNAGAEHWSRELELKQGGGGVYAGAKVGEEAVYAAATVAQLSTRCGAWLRDGRVFVCWWEPGGGVRA